MDLSLTLPASKHPPEVGHVLYGFTLKRTSFRFGALEIGRLAAFLPNRYVNKHGEVNHHYSSILYSLIGQSILAQEYNVDRCSMENNSNNKMA